MRENVPDALRCNIADARLSDPEEESVGRLFLRPLRRFRIFLPDEARPNRFPLCLVNTRESHS